MKTRPWAHAALVIDECQIRLGHLEYRRDNLPRYYDEAEHKMEIEAYRSWLEAVRAAIDEELAGLPPPVPPLPPVEKVAGYVSPSVHG